MTDKSQAPARAAQLVFPPPVCPPPARPASHTLHLRYIPACLPPVRPASHTLHCRYTYTCITFPFAIFQRALRHRLTVRNGAPAPRTNAPHLPPHIPTRLISSPTYQPQLLTMTAEVASISLLILRTSTKRSSVERLTCSTNPRKRDTCAASSGVYNE